MENKDKIEIPFGAKDSELCECEYTILEGYEAEIKDGKVIIRKKESEDEGIRKEILDYIIKGSESCYDVQQYGREKFEKWIAWLEKKGEQKHQYISRPKYIGEEELLGEQKPTEWSEEDEEISEAIIKRIKGESEALSVSLSSATSWVGNIKDRVQLQSQWKPSKEQLHILESVIADYDNQGLSYTKDMLCDLYEQLKKL